MSGTFRQRQQRQLACVARFNDALCVQLAEAYRQHKQRSYAMRRDLGAHLGDITQASFVGNEPCSQLTCKSATFPLRVYRFEAPDAETFRSYHMAREMFIPHYGVECAAEIGVLINATKASVARVMLHVCAEFCPGYAQSHVDPLHSDELRSAELGTVVHFCTCHSRFHVCDALCQYQTMTSGATAVCALSRIVGSVESQQFSFGDGTGSKDRADKAEANNDNSADGGGPDEKRRKRSASTRINVRNGAAAAAKKAAAKLAATMSKEETAARARQRKNESAAKRKKASKMRGANKPSQISDEPLLIRLAPQDMKYLPESLGDDVLLGDALVRIRPTAPFEYRKNGTYDREYALDELRRLHHRARLGQQFMLGRSVESNTFFTDESLLSQHLVIAYEIVEYMIFGEQVAVMARAAHTRAHETARKAVNQYLTDSRKRGDCVVFDTLDQVYVEALTNAHLYVAVVIDEKIKRAALTYYALLIVEFFFGLMALEVDVPNEDAHAAYATVRREFSFEYFVPVIVDMMHAVNYEIDGICVLPRDTFLLGQYCPDWGVLRALGVSEHQANTLKTLLKQLIEIARRRTPMRSLQATTLAWVDICDLARESTIDEVGERVIKLFVSARRTRITDMTRVVSPLDNPHPAVVDLTKLETKHFKEEDPDVDDLTI
jgi:hypothetical protein